MKSWHIDSLNEVVLKENTLIASEGERKLKISKLALSGASISSFAARNNKDITVMGHSAVAFVTEDDEVNQFKLGARVVISPFIKSVLGGEVSYKVMGVDVNGLMQDFVCVPVGNIFALPDGITDDEAVFAEYIAMGSKVFSELNCESGDYVVIVGAGTLGLIACQLAGYYQMVPILIDMDADRLEMAKKWNVCYTLNPTFDNLERKVEEITGGRMCEGAVFTSDGTDLNAALRLVKSEREVVIAGYNLCDKQNIDMDIVLKRQLNLKGICNGAGEMPSAINLLANHIIRTDGLITDRADFDDFPKVFAKGREYSFKNDTVLINFN